MNYQYNKACVQSILIQSTPSDRAARIGCGGRIGRSVDRKLSPRQTGDRSARYVDPVADPIPDAPRRDDGARGCTDCDWGRLSGS